MAEKRNVKKNLDNNTRLVLIAVSVEVKQSVEGEGCGFGARGGGKLMILPPPFYACVGNRRQRLSIAMEREASRRFRSGCWFLMSKSPSRTLLNLMLWWHCIFSQRESDWIITSWLLGSWSTWNHSYRGVIFFDQLRQGSQLSKVCSSSCLSKYTPFYFCSPLRCWIVDRSSRIQLLWSITRWTERWSWLFNGVLLVQLKNHLLQCLVFLTEELTLYIFLFFLRKKRKVYHLTDAILYNGRMYQKASHLVLDAPGSLIIDECFKQPSTIGQVRSFYFCV